jgi:hypothetical protein
MEMYAKATPAVTAQIFTEAERMMPLQLLRNHLERATSSVEAFFNMRSNFVQSISAFCIGSYILGIGDRHLDNFLLDKCDGSIVGIDFGLAFGNGLGLPAPELIPFRLTKQFLGVHGLHGQRVFELGMVHAMRALASAADTLLSIMEVFINEPLLDWNKDVCMTTVRQQKQLKDQNKNIDEDVDAGIDSREANASQLSGTSGSLVSSDARDSTKGATELRWLPHRKIHYAREKLHRGNPAHIMLHEFRDSGHSSTKRYAQQIEHCILPPATTIKAGSRRCNDPNDSVPCKRAVQPRQCESVEDQVACLIEMAREPNILGRQYFGLTTWV